jgi:hypothetical protein
MSEKRVYKPKDTTKKYQPKNLTPQVSAEETKQPEPVAKEPKKDQV